MQKDGAVLYLRLVESLTERAYLKRAKYAKKEMLSLMQETGMRQGAAALTARGAFTAEDVLELCRTALGRIDDEPRGGWLPYIYNMLVSGLYPDTQKECAHESGCFFYLQVLRAVLAFEKSHARFEPMSQFSLLTGDEAAKSPARAQYGRFLDVVHDCFFVELMHIGRAIMPFDMLGHVAGVHHVAMHMARQLKMCGVHVDLSLVSASAMMHDVGKYGCKGDDARRIPYLHYYYTEEFLKRHELFSVAHVAANHSTWDLELENLPVETLLLIYADFRVKSLYENGSERVRFYTLAESYGIILGKLDNVDDAKRRRYGRAYLKLSDFEQYMLSLGVNPDPYSAAPGTKEKQNAALLTAEEAVRALKLEAVAHNLRLMGRLSSEASFADLLEDARSEKDWKNIRTYVNIIEEYFTYMTQKQKRLTMRFLYELFMHAQGDIRSQAATLYGRILAGYDAVYRKELPKAALRPAQPEDTSASLWEEWLHRILAPDFKLAEKLRTWISYSLKNVLPALLENCAKSKADAYLAPYLECFTLERYQDDFISGVLLDSLIQLPQDLLTLDRLQAPFRMAARLIASGEPKNQAFALLFALWALDGGYTCGKEVLALIRLLPQNRNIAVEYLLMNVYERLNAEEHLRAQCEAHLAAQDVGEIYLENLKAATPWVMKEANIRFLLYRAEKDGTANAFQVATHLVNLIRVSERFALRHRAGQALERIAPMLTLDQRNEIAVELTRGMESANDDFSKYIPQYLGRFVLYLHPKELDEVLDMFHQRIKSASERSACIVLTTLGVLLRLYDGAYQETFKEDEAVFLARRLSMLSMLTSGLAHYNITIAREACLVMGKQVFGGGLPHALGCELFAHMHKKFLLLLKEQEEDKLTFFNNAASLNHIYRFIVDYTTRFGPMRFNGRKKIAFFPGTFDPFSSSHKAIVHEVRRHGFEVYLALDEFSWSKRTQPHMIRRRIVDMSVADMFDVYLFPDNIPVNLANPGDIRHLSTLFPGSEVYVAVGSDVIKNASAYKKPPEEGSIHSLGHIVFLRSTEPSLSPEERSARYTAITGDVLELTLDGYFEEVSSTRIRENIDHNREISMLVDPVAQGYIYDNGLYLREPEYKELLRPEELAFRSFAPDDDAMRGELIRAAIENSRLCIAPMDAARIAELIHERLQKPKAKILALFGGKSHHPLGLACTYATNAEFLFDEFRSVPLAEYMRRHTSGRIAVVAGVFAYGEETRYDVMRLLITEALAKCLMEDYTYALHVGVNGLEDDTFHDLLARRGFLRLSDQDNSAPVSVVDMRVPIALIEDVQERIKAPLSHDPEVVRTLRKAHHDFTIAMTKLYPGRLVLSFHAGLLNHSLVKKVLRANNVAHIPPEARQLGECMCVPYGKTLRGVAVPNTVTKTLHVDKAYQPDMKSFDILKYPGYSTLLNQVRTIKSFNRPVILVDDLLHKGYRLETLDPLFKEAGLDIREIIVGILSGRGKDLMSAQGRQAQGVYFIPNLRYWFVDSMLYPFLGGDSVQRPGAHATYPLPSVNQIFPYTSPLFISGASKQSLFDLSLTCLQNARDILMTLERRHQELFGYNLTLSRLGQAMQAARAPDKGGCMRYDLNLAPSVYVENDIEMLLRLEYLLRGN